MARVSSRRPVGRIVRQTAMALLVLGPAAGVGYLLGSNSLQEAAAAGGTPYRKLQVFSRVLAYVERNYVSQPDEEKLIYGAIQGMIGTLDPHSLFMPPDVYREMKSTVVGEYGGVGLELGIRDGAVTVIAPVDGTPAQRAGFQSGDVLVEIDGQSTEGLALFDAAMRIRGAPGTTVRFLVRRRGLADPLTIEVQREQLIIIPVEGRVLAGTYIYLKIKNFQKNTFAMLAEQLERLEAAAGGAGKASGLILDLRNNPGGLLEQAIKVSDEFLDEGLIVSTEGRAKRDVEKHFAQRGGRLALPMVVLVNGIKQLQVPLWRSYLAGAILLGIAPCTAMVLVWGYLARGNDGLTLVMVAINSLTMLVLYGPLGGFLLGVGRLPVPWQALVLSIAIYVALPLVAGYFSRKWIIAAKGVTWFTEKFLHILSPITIVALLTTLVLLFSFKGEVIVANPLTILWIAIPLFIQTILIFAIGYWAAKAMKLPYEDAAPAAMIGASNHFEVAIATATMLFGLSSGAALATVVGVLIEVPVMLMLVRFCLKTRNWFDSPGKA